MKQEESVHPQTLDQTKEERRLGDNESATKLHAVHPTDGEEAHKSSVYEHLQKTDSGYDAETFDLATEEQAEIRAVASRADEDVNMEDYVLPDPNNEPATKESAQTLQSEFKKIDPSTVKKSVSATAEEIGERVPILGAATGSESTIRTWYDPQVPIDVTYLGRSITSKAEVMWRQIDRFVSPLIQEPFEQPRLVLKPTKTAKMKGDYRTGKRLNIRKVIPYIASQFRKDKIWPRRIKPIKRQYQILMDLDDSSSTDDNQSRQKAYESLAFLGKITTLLEAGNLSVVSFGERVNLVHPLGEAFMARILQELTFVQQKTRVAEMLHFAAELLSTTTSRDTAQLLVIVSDGRGIFTEGEEKVKPGHQTNQGVQYFYCLCDIGRS